MTKNLWEGASVIESVTESLSHFPPHNDSSKSCYDGTPPSPLSDKSEKSVIRKKLESWVAKRLRIWLIVLIWEVRWDTALPLSDKSEKSVINNKLEPWIAQRIRIWLIVLIWEVRWDTALPPSDKSEKSVISKKKIFRSILTSHFGEQPNLTQSNSLVWFFKDNSIIFRPFENFFIHLPAIRYISYQEMNIIANVCVNPNEQCQTCLNDAMASKGAWQRTTNSVEFNNNWM